MKKLLISLLLISLITMVGVFAEGEDPAPTAPTPQSATLTLQTSIDAITKIGITDANTPDPAYGSGNDKVTADLFDEVDYSDTGATVAYVHYQTNDNVGMKVMMSGSTLKHETLANTISYTLASYRDSHLVGSITPVFADETLSGNTFEIFTKTANEGLVTETQRLNLIVVGNADDYPAGAYEATITFTLQAQ